MPKFDTSFNFGANVAGGGGKAKKPNATKVKRKRPKGTSSKSRRYFSAMHGP